MLGFKIGIPTVQNPKGETHTFREGVNGVSVPDSWLIESIPTSNFGSAAGFNVREFNGNVFRVVIRFDLSGISGILSATLSLTCSFVGTGGRAGKIRRLTQAWTEGGVSWNTYDGVTAWATPGGDYTTDGEIDIIFPSETGVVNYDVSSLAIDAENNRSGSLDLLLMLADEAAGDDRADFDSGEATTESDRPLLTVVT